MNNFLKFFNWLVRRYFVRVVIMTSLFTLNAYAFENLVYTVRGFPKDIAQGSIAVEDFKRHASQIDILSAQAYAIDDKGVVFGTLNPQVVSTALASHVQLMPLVANMNFNPTLVHLFLNDEAAQDRAVGSLLKICKENNLLGLQIDFEGMSFLDRALFTRFYQKIASVLHQNGFKIAIAIVPKVSDRSPANIYLKNKYERWTGVYDYKALGESSDFVTLMAYDNHGSITPPGPMAGFMWDEAVIQYGLKYIPPLKISLGIPWRSGLWYTGSDSQDSKNVVSVIYEDITFFDATRMLRDNHASLQWDEKDKVHYAMYRHHFLYEYIFMEDADSFKAKVSLVKKYHLRGISNWCLGGEDPKIWEQLPKR